MFRQFFARATATTIAQQQQAKLTQTATATTKRSFSVGGQFKKDESALERDFIHKEERALLDNLANLQRKKQSLDHAAHLKTLSETLVKNRIEPTSKVTQDLMAWRISSIVD